MQTLRTAMVVTAFILLAGCTQTCPSNRVGYVDQTSVYQARDQAVRAAQEAAQAAAEAKAASEKASRAFRQSQMK